MRSAITFISANRPIFINTEYIQTILEDSSNTNKTWIILSNGVQYKVKVPINTVIRKIKEVVESSIQTGSFASTSLNCPMGVS